MVPCLSLGEFQIAVYLGSSLLLPMSFEPASAMSAFGKRSSRSEWPTSARTLSLPLSHSWDELIPLRRHKDVGGATALEDCPAEKPGVAGSGGVGLRSAAQGNKPLELAAVRIPLKALRRTQCHTRVCEPSVP